MLKACRRVFVRQVAFSDHDAKCMTVNVQRPGAAEARASRRATSWRIKESNAEKTLSLNLDAMRGPSTTSKANRTEIAARIDTALKAWPGLSESIPEHDLFDDCFQTEDPDQMGAL
eukprot:4307338-Heterocapsa_arctica.AAC.1